MLAHVALNLHLAHQAPGLPANHLVCLFIQAAIGILLVIDGVAFCIAQRIDKHRLALMAEHGMETLRTEVKPPRLLRRRRIVSLEGLDIGIFGRQIRRQQIVGLQDKRHLSPVGQRQLQLALPGNQPTYVIKRNLDHPELVGPYFIAICCGGACRHRVPLFGHQVGRRHQGGDD